jgi:iron complex transport system ATP-binding protein
LIACVSLTAAAVAACGLIGFVGLIAPHAARRVVGPAHRGLLPLSAALGALLVVVADAVARSAFAPREVPVGLLTAALGGPLFLLQLQRDARDRAPAARTRRGARPAQRIELGQQPPGPDVERRPGSTLLDRSGAPGPVLAARGLAVGRDGSSVLEGVDLIVQRGERVALVGENGAGKTTLLRALAGLDTPLSGQLAWRGAGLPAGAARAQVLGVLLQAERAPSFRVRELVGLGLGHDRRLRDAEWQRVDDAIAHAGLSALAERPCTSLSGGEAQRAALARALVSGPALLLLDEPTHHLDPARHAAFVRELDRLRGSVAVVIATHELGLAASCDRVVLLHDGAVAAQGAPRDVLTPALLSRCLGIVAPRSEVAA